MFFFVFYAGVGTFGPDCVCDSAAKDHGQGDVSRVVGEHLSLSLLFIYIGWLNLASYFLGKQ